MTTVVNLALALAVFIFVVYPFYRRKWQPLPQTDEGKIRELHSRRDTSYSMLKELEFDYQSGILTEEDYRDLVSRYKGKAIEVLKDMDALEKDNVESEDAIERQVKKLRRNRNAKTSRADNSVGDTIEQQVRQLRQKPGSFCRQCGAKLRDDDRFCSRCGTKLS
jgi:hypothetical protein